MERLFAMDYWACGNLLKGASTGVPVSGFPLYLSRVTQNYHSFLTLFANTGKDAASIPKPAF
jgi:hypothetical protein